MVQAGWILRFIRLGLAFQSDSPSACDAYFKHRLHNRRAFRGMLRHHWYSLTPLQ